MGEGGRTFMVLVERGVCASPDLCLCVCLQPCTQAEKYQLHDIQQQAVTLAAQGGCMLLGECGTLCVHHLHFVYKEGGCEVPTRP